MRGRTGENLLHDALCERSGPLMVLLDDLDRFPNADMTSYGSTHGQGCFGREDTLFCLIFVLLR